ncbi:MAG: hypothetical protein JW986_09580 [Methanotrichaceae archaeon]|nr:hypothetical protein [Methanotrichaceae archaeon]
MKRTPAAVALMLLLSIALAGADIGGISFNNSGESSLNAAVSSSNATDVNMSSAVSAPFASDSSLNTAVSSRNATLFGLNATNASLNATAAGLSGFNGTTYRVSPSTVVVELPVNASSMEVVLLQKADSIALQDAVLGTVMINSTYTFWRGEHRYSLVFPRGVNGLLRIELPGQGQRFISPMSVSGAVRVVLPPGYATGERMLGIARPTPASVEVIDGVYILTWDEAPPALDVSYYRVDAPRYLQMSLLLIIFLASLIALDYYLSMKRLRSIREAEEGATSSK